MKTPKNIFKDVQPITDEDIAHLENKGFLVKPQVTIKGGPRSGHTQTNRNAGEVVCHRAFYDALGKGTTTQRDARQLLLIEAGRKGGSRNSHVQKLLNLAFFEDKMEAMGIIEKFGDGVAG